MIRCQSCGKELPDGSKFCDACGSLINEAPATNNYADNAYTGDVNGGNTAAKSGNMKKYLMLGGIALAAVILLIVIIACIASSGEAKSNHALYMKDGELWFTDLGKIEASEMADNISGDVQLSDDGEILAYVEDLEDYTLYWRYANKPDKEPVEVKDDVADFTLTEDGKYIIIETNDGGIYEYDVKKQEDVKVNKDASVSQYGDAGFIYYETKTEEKTKTDDDGEEYTTEVELRTFFLKKFGKEESIELADEIEGGLAAVNEDEMKEFYYLDDEEVYMIKKPGKEAEKIESGVDNLVALFENGDLYFIKSEETEISVGDNTMEIDNRTLYYYNGKESAKVIEYCADFEDVAVEESVMVISVYNTGEVSEDTSLYDTAEAYLVTKGTANAIGKDDAEGFTVSEDGSTVYYFADIARDGETEEFNSASLYKIAVGKDSIKSNEKIASDVNGEYVLLDHETGKKVAYIKDWDKDEAEGTLCVDDKEIDTEVHEIYKVHAYSTAFLYQKDYKDGEFTLMLCDNAKSGEKVDDDVYRAYFTDEGDVLYLCDYDMEKNEGTLNVFNGKIEAIDTEVNSIIADADANKTVYENIVD